MMGRKEAGAQVVTNGNNGTKQCKWLCNEDNDGNQSQRATRRWGRGCWLAGSPPARRAHERREESKMAMFTYRKQYQSELATQSCIRRRRGG